MPGETEILYVGDPMCSWCWGFSPILRQLRDHFADEITFSMKVGGLRPGSKTPMDAKLRGYLRQHWDDVRTTTGQVFNFALLEKHHLVYDTEPACRAIVTVQQLAPWHTFDFFEALQESFYIENLDITLSANLAGIAAKFGIDRIPFQEKFDSRAASVRTYETFIEVRKLGVQGFPSLLFRSGDRYAFLARSYQPFEKLQEATRRLLDDNGTARDSMLRAG